MKQDPSSPNPKQRRLGFLAGLFMGRPRRPKSTPPELYKKDFKSNTRKIGIRFTEKLRSAFRSRWLRLK